MNTPVDFGDILVQAWRIMWRNRGLWLLGILVACGTANGGTVDFNFSSGSGSSGQGNFPSELTRIFSWIEANNQLIITGLIALVCVGLVISVIVFVLSLMARGGLLAGARLAQANGQVKFSEAWGEGRRNFGRLFSIWLFTELPFLLVGILTAGATAFALLSAFTAASWRWRDIGPAFGGGLGLFFLCLLPFICIFGLANFVARILAHMGTLAAVFEERSGLDALRRGWALLRADPLSYIILGVILAVLIGIVNFIAGVPIFIIVFPAMISTMFGVATENQALIGGGLAFALLCGAAYAPVMYFVAGLLQTWAHAAWALLYQKLASGSAPAAAPLAPINPEPEPAPLA